MIWDPLGGRRSQSQPCSNTPHSKVDKNMVWEGRDLLYFDVLESLAKTIVSQESRCLVMSCIAAVQEDHQE